MDAKPGRATEGAREVTAAWLLVTVPRGGSASARDRLPDYFVFWIARIYPAYSQDVLRGPETQIVHVIGDIEPPVDHTRRDDNDIASLHFDFFHAIGRAGAGWPVWPAWIVILAAVIPIHDVAVGEHDVRRRR